MYLRNLHIRNVGPLNKLDLEFELQESLDPKPIILVGRNGSGKTYTLSYIVDSFYELAKKNFSDVLKDQSSVSSPYFRTISGKDISANTSGKSGAAYLRITGENSQEEMHYCEKIGEMEASQELLNLYGNKISNFKNNNVSSKEVVGSEENINKLFSNIVTFFPSFRKIAPHWLNLNAQNQNLFNIETKFSGRLNKEIMCIDTFQTNIQWMLDVILDSALLPAELDHIIDAEKKQLEINNKHAINQSYRNINKIFQTILENNKIYLKTGWRNSGQARLSLHSEGKVVVPTLEQLSTGQLILLNLFLTIIRHADYKDLNNSIKLENIKGIVVIDEIDTHLHSKHQSEVLPELMSLFPKIQFIVTSHSPLFVIGIEKKFGEKNVQIIDLPLGINITSERFNEFEESFNLYKETTKFEENLHKKIQETLKPLILVEGKTDIKFLKKALELKGKNDWLESIDIDEIGMTQEDGQVKFGGESSLDKGFEFLKHNLSAINRKVLFLYDCDTKITTQTVGKIRQDKVPYNEDNKKVKKGSENLLREDLFTDNFYPVKEKVDDYGCIQTIQKFEKNKFCDHIVETVTDETVFDKYEQLVFPIIERFLQDK